MTISFECSPADLETILRIAERAVHHPIIGEYLDDKTTIIMDINATHSNGCPLRLGMFEGSNDPDFIHDILGIRRHINRKTGRLEDCFTPRFAQ